MGAAGSAKNRKNADRQTLLIYTIASLLPVVSIVVLYLVDSMPKRLGIVAGFTAAFSIALALFTRARRVDIFAATAA
jgi:hypothetical protein